MKNILFVLCAWLLIACNNQIDLSGSVEKKQLTLTGFHSVSIDNGFALTVERGHSNLVDIETDKQIYTTLQTQVIDSVLYISSPESGRFPDNAKVHITIFKDSLRLIQASNQSKIAIKDTLFANSLHLSLTDGSSIAASQIQCRQLSTTLLNGTIATLTGSTVYFTASLSQQSNLSAKELITDTTQLSLSYGSKGVVYVNDQIHVDLSKASVLDCDGYPTDVVSKIDDRSQFNLLQARDSLSNYEL